jgi:hypothetical protein
MKKRGVIAPELMEEVIALYRSAHKVVKEGSRLPIGDVVVPGAALDELNSAVGNLHSAIGRMRSQGC